MWTRFLDRTSEGTLFNFGNPFRQNNPFGFQLDTIVLSPDSPTGLGGNPTMESVSGFTSVSYDRNPNGDLWQNTGTERFVRLIVYDDVAGKTYDSHTTGVHSHKEVCTPFPGADCITGSDILSMLNNVRVPYNPGEWYFICATFNPNVDQDNSYDTVTGLSFDNKHDFWTGNRNLDGSYTHYSGYGNKCKVEIISRTDLLRARGYKV